MLNIFGTYFKCIILVNSLYVNVLSFLRRSMSLWLLVWFLANYICVLLLLCSRLLLWEWSLGYFVLKWFFILVVLQGCKHMWRCCSWPNIYIFNIVIFFQMHRSWQKELIYWPNLCKSIFWALSFCNHQSKIEALNSSILCI